MKTVGTLVSGAHPKRRPGGRVTVVFGQDGIAVYAGRLWRRRELLRIGYGDVSDVAYRAPSPTCRGSLVVYLREKGDFNQYFQFAVNGRNVRAAERVRSYLAERL